MNRIDMFSLNTGITSVLRPLATHIQHLKKVFKNNEVMFHNLLGGLPGVLLTKEVVL